MFLGHAFDVFGWYLMNKYHNRTYLMSKLVNIYTLFLAIVVRYVTCSLRIYFIFFIKLFSHLPGIIEGYSLRINSYINNYGIYTKCYKAMARSKGGCSAASSFKSNHCYITQNIEHYQKTSNLCPKNIA